MLLRRGSLTALWGLSALLWLSGCGLLCSLRWLCWLLGLSTLLLLTAKDPADTAADTADRLTDTLTNAADRLTDTLTNTTHSFAKPRAEATDRLADATGQIVQRATGQSAHQAT